jgi:ABC-2 type transport system permease protein
MSAVTLIATENVKRFVRNRSFYAVALLAPFLIMAALSATIGPALSGEFRPSLAIADELGNGSLDELVAGLQAAGFDDLQLVDSEAAARQLVDDGDAGAAILYRPEIGRSLSDPTASTATIVVVADAESEIAGDIATAIAEQSARNVDTVRVLSLVGAPLDDLDGPLELVDADDVGARVLTDGTYFAVGISSYFAFFAASIFVATIHQERRDSTLARMLAAPIDHFAPLIGKGVAAGAVALFSSAVLVVSSTLLLGSSWGPPLGVLLVIIAVCFAAVGVAMAVVSVTKTEESAAQIGSVLATAWAIFGGVFLEIPAEGPLSAASRLSPFRWTLDAIGLNAGSGTLGEVAVHAAAIAAFGLVGLAIAYARRDQLGRI